MFSELLILERVISTPASMPSQGLFHNHKLGPYN